MRKKFPGWGACPSSGSSCASTVDTRPISVCESLISLVSYLLRWHPAEQRGLFKFLQYIHCAGLYSDVRLHVVEDAMTTTVKGIPEGASVVIPRLFCHDVASEIHFCVKTFGAVERVRRP